MRVETEHSRPLFFFAGKLVGGLLGDAEAGNVRRPNPAQDVESTAENAAAKDAAADFGGCFAAGTFVLTTEGKLPIEKVRIGQRVLTRPEGMDELPDAPVIPANLRVIRLQFERPAGRGAVEIALLRAASQLEGLGRGDTLPLNVLELEIEGRGQVVAIEPCPPITDGPGELVTGTFRSVTPDLRSLRIHGLAEPLAVTAGHRIYSDDRVAFVRVSDLSPGDRVRTRSGRTPVTSVERHFGSYPVYNLEVGRVHQYYVSDAEILAHNGCGAAGAGDSGAAKKAAMRDALNDVREEAIATGEPIPGIHEPGPFAGEGAPVNSGASVRSKAITEAVNAEGAKSGCHICGTSTPGTTSGNWVKDHIPATALNSSETQVLYPSCQTCSDQQGGFVATLKLLQKFLGIIGT